VDEASRFNPAWGVWEQDLVEAYVRADRLDEAGSLTHAFQRFAEANVFPLAVSIAERCRGLIAEEPTQVDHHFTRAIELGGGTVLSRARAHLCWGWKLRSLGAGDAAAAHDEQAATLGESIAAFAIVDRARTALDAAGATVAAARLPLARRLTAEELRVAAAVADGVDLTTVGASILRAEPTVRKLLDAVYDEAGVQSPVALAEELDRSSGGNAPVGGGGAVAIRVLGRFEVTVDDTPVLVPEGQPAALVKLVCVRGGQIHIDELVDALWPEAPLGRGRNRLRNVLNRLRRAAGDTVIRRGELLTLAEGVTCDAIVFDQTSRAALEARPRDAEQAEALARSAVASYGGELLPDSVYEEWSTAPRERLTRRHLALLDLLAEAAAQDGRVDEAIRWWTQAADAEPLDESRLVRAATLLVDHERHGQARSLIDRARSVVEDLGTNAPAALVAIESRLARGG